VSAEEARETVHPAGDELLGRSRGLRWFGQGRGALVQARPDVIGGVGAALPFVARQHGAGGGDTGEAGQSEELPWAHGP